MFSFFYASAILIYYNVIITIAKIFRVISIERMFHFCEELSLFIGHIFVLLFRDKVENAVNEVSFAE